MNDGGPAFPRPASEFTKNGTLPDGNRAEDAQDGMSLRDWLAGMAPPMPEELYEASAMRTSATVAALARAAAESQWRYLYADAMLEARKA